jgi:hypothetical protein
VRGDDRSTSGRGRHASVPMVDPNDWRIASGQELWCHGLIFKWSQWAPTPTIAYKPDGSTEPAIWDHDHCEFCWREFGDIDHACSDGSPALTEGWAAARPGGATRRAAARQLPLGQSDVLPGLQGPLRMDDRRLTVVIGRDAHAVARGAAGGVVPARAVGMANSCRSSRWQNDDCDHGEHEGGVVRAARRGRLSGGADWANWGGGTSGTAASDHRDTDAGACRRSTRTRDAVQAHRATPS